MVSLIVEELQEHEEDTAGRDRLTDPAPQSAATKEQAPAEPAKPAEPAPAAAAAQATATS
jgi:hypothetical protein